MESLSVVIPAYNEEKRIKDSLIKIRDYLENKKINYELIVVDDGSTDKTIDVINNCGIKNLRIIRNKKNMGKGYSVMRGFLSCTKTLSLFSDSDLATPIEEIDQFLKHISKGYDIVIASRNLKESNIIVKQPKYRQMMGKAFPMLVNLIILKDFKDTQCGFKLFRSEVAKEIVQYQRFYGFIFDVELLFLAKKKGYRIFEAPVKWVDIKGSKVNPIKDSISMLIDLILIRINDLFGKY